MSYVPCVSALSTKLGLIKMSLLKVLLLKTHTRTRTQTSFTVFLKGVIILCVAEGMELTCYKARFRFFWTTKGKHIV